MTAPAKRPRIRRGDAKLLRAAAAVTVFAGPLGFVPVSKQTARRLLRQQAGPVTAEYVPGLDLLVIEAAAR